MNWIDQLDKRFGRWALPHLTIYLLVLQGVGVLLLATGTVPHYELVMTGGLVKSGQWWRLISFLMMPRTMSPIWLIFSFIIFYMMGSSLEMRWGTFRYNLFLFCSYWLTIVGSFIFPNAIISNIYFLGGVFLAFATLFPNFEFLLFFILPVKVKWLGMLTAGLYIFTLLTSHVGNRVAVAAVFINYLLFFGKDFLHNRQMVNRRKEFQAKQLKVEESFRNQCEVCKANDASDPDLDFRYCASCGRCFCSVHINDHSHETPPE